MNTETILRVIGDAVASMNCLIDASAGNPYQQRTYDAIGYALDALRSAGVAFASPSPTLGRGCAVGVTDSQYRRYLLREAVLSVRSVKRRVAKETKRTS